MSDIQSLNGVTSGRYEIETINGTHHIFDFDAMWIKRVPAPGREWPAEAMGARRDGNEIPVASFRGATVGENMIVIENTPSRDWRMTSPIVSIRRICLDCSTRKDHSN